MNDFAVEEQTKDRAMAILKSDQLVIYKRKDRLFALLLACEWLAGIAVALIVSPRAWAGHYSSTQIHVWTAIFLGGMIAAWPIYLAIKHPGQTFTRHVIAIGNMLSAALLIHLTGGRIETHFQVFGLLAFLSFYRDWRVLISASLVVATDHILRGLLFPQSIYGVAEIEPWRWLEHVWWVVFEDIFLVLACLNSSRDMWLSAYRQAKAEEINASIEATVRKRTLELSETRLRLNLQYAVSRTLAEAITFNEAIPKILRLIAETMLGEHGAVWCAFWSENHETGALVCFDWVRTDDGQLDAFLQASANSNFYGGKGLPGRTWQSRVPERIRDLAQDDNLPRQKTAIDCGFTDAFAFPVLNKETPLGVIECFTEVPFQFTVETLEMLQSIGTEMGHFMVRNKSEQEQARLASVVEHSSDAIFTKSADNVITSWNRGAEVIFGYSAEEAIGKNIAMLIPPEKQDEISNFESLAKAGKRFDNYHSQRLTKTGHLLEVSISWAPAFDETGACSGASVTIRDITERMEAERRVAEFYSMVSHELRTPLTAIRGALGLIEGRMVELSSDEGMDLVQMGRTNADRLIRLVNDMLDLKKIEAGKLDLKCCSMDAHELVADTIASISAMADEANVHLSNEARRGDTVFGDRDKVVQVLTNLAANAIKFSSTESRVSITTKITADGRTRFSVTDAGPGIAPDDVSKLFHKFQQLDSSDSRRQGGTGLGLAISKSLVEQHGGTIGVNSRPGRGSTFWFELPAEAQEDPLAVAS